MIDDDITYAEKGYRSTDLKPKSNKLVWAICEGENCEREGGRGRWAIFNQYYDLCHGCAMKIRYTIKDGDKIDKLDYIDDDITFAEKGYRSTDLMPKSGKEVYAICSNPDCEREGGRGRWVKFSQRSYLCRQCVGRTENYRKTLIEAHADSSGENNGNWKGGITPANKKFRDSTEYAEWRISVFERDDYTCQECGDSTGGNLNAHHILPYRDYGDTEYSLDIDNGITLCEGCHDKTKRREYEFVDKYQKIVNIIMLGVD